jgi:outer membrane protein W
MKRFAIPGALALAVAAAVPAQAAQADYNLKIFGGVAYVSPLSDDSLEGIADSVEASSEVGYEIGGEWKPFNRFGFEVSYLDAKHDVEADGQVIGEVSLRPWNFTLNWHVINGEHFNWYLGPTVAFVDWSSLELSGGGSVDVDSETTFGLSTGIDFGITESFAIFGGLRWLDASVESDDLPNSVAVDPLFARVGVAFRF